MSFNAGQLRHRLDLQEKQETQDQTTGDVTAQWVTVAAALAASIEPLSAREFVAAQAVDSGVSVRVTIRARAGVVAKMRLVDVVTGKVYNIAGVLTDKQSGTQYMTLPCSEGTNDG